MSDERNPSEIEAQLTRLADGTLPQSLQDVLREQARQDPELAAKLAEQERGAAIVRAVDVDAPDALRAQLDAILGEPVADPTAAGQRRRAAEAEQRAAEAFYAAPGDDTEEAERRLNRDRRPSREPRPRREHRGPNWRGSRNPRWRRTVFLPAAAGIAAVIAAVVIVLGNTSPAPTIHETAAVALGSATAPAPPPAPGRPELLAAAVDGIPFPSYAANTRFQAVGSRTQTVDRRKIVTVYYRSSDGTRVGYSIVPGGALSTKGGTSSTTRGGVRYTFGTAVSGRYVTWKRGGHTCVIAGRTAGDATLLALAVADERTSV